MILIEMILMGVFATYFMDLAAGFLIKRNVMKSFIKPEIIGRWFLYLFRGKYIHTDINKTPALNNEKFWAVVSHYLIGIVLSGIYLFMELKIPIIRDQIWMPLIFGTATVILPWFWLFPSIGIGFLASKAPNRLNIVITNLGNHINFGLGLFIWWITFHRFFI